jgi:hypothetical protein
MLYLTHDDTQKHKYIAKEKITEKYTRYFYSQEEYDAYLDKKNSAVNVSGIIEDAEGIAGGILDFASGLFNSAKNTIDELLKNGKNFIDDLFESNTLDETDLPDSKHRVSKASENVEWGEGEIEKYDENTGETKKYKYIAKIPTSYGYRYFYSQEEYDRWNEKQWYQENEPDYMKDIPEVVDDMTDEDDMYEINNYQTDDDYASHTNCMMCTMAYELRQRGYDVDAIDKTSWYTVNNASDCFENVEMHGYLGDSDSQKQAVKKMYTNHYGEDYLHELYESSNTKGYYNTFDDYMDDMADEYIKKNLKSQTSTGYKYANSAYTRSSEYSNESTCDTSANVSASNITNEIKTYSGNDSRGNFIVYWASGGGHSMAYEVDSNGDIKILDCQNNVTYTVDEVLDKGCTSVFFYQTDNLALKEGILDAVTNN